MKYCIITSTGFQMNGSEAATYDSAEDAAPHMGPGDQIIPIVESATVVKFIPEYDRHGDK